MYSIQLYKLYYKIKHETVPIYFKTVLIPMHNPYNTRHQFISYPKSLHEFARKTCIYQLINLINYPPEDTNLRMNTTMVNTHSLQGFVFYHKTKTLCSYSAICSITDCYVCHICSLYH